MAYLDNPTSPGPGTTPAQITLDLSVYDDSGNSVEPSAANPITVTIYGAPDGVLTPTTQTLTDGTTATFDYTGAYFPNDITVTASMPISGGQAIGITQILHQNTIDCDYGSTSYTVALNCDGATSPDECASHNIANGLRLDATVGYASPTAGDFKTFTVDTGSLGVIVPVGELGPDAVGPGPAGQIAYNSSGDGFAGRYYLAPVGFKLADGTSVLTDPIKVLAITSTYCLPHSKCNPEHPPAPTLHYLGIGFDRGKVNSLNGFGTPADNAALHITTASNGTDVSPGYVLTGSMLTLGIVSTQGFELAALTPNPEVPGDWETAPGCFAFPELEQPNQFCGTLLLDVGITEMFLQLPPDQRPEGSVDEHKQVPEGVKMQILVGTADNPAMSYEYTMSKNPPAESLQPDYVDWNDMSGTFVNTGRHPLYGYDYLYDARCGNVGFQAVSAAP